MIYMLAYNFVYTIWRASYKIQYCSIKIMQKHPQEAYNLVWDMSIQNKWKLYVESDHVLKQVQMTYFKRSGKEMITSH